MLFDRCAINKKCRSHQLDPESVWITSVPSFLIEKNTKYIFRRGTFGIWLMGIFPKKEICHQNLDHIIRTLNLSNFCLYLISLLRKTQNTWWTLCSNPTFIISIWIPSGLHLDSMESRWTPHSPPGIYGGG